MRATSPVSLRPLLLSVLFSLTLTAAARAATQNKLINRRYHWRVAQSEHFDIYYYEGAERLLPAVTEDLERAWLHVGKALGIEPPKRSSFFLFLDHNQFEQNNIVDVGEGTGGVTEAFKDRFLIFNDGTRAWLEHVVTHEFTHVVQFQVLYGGFWKSVRLLKSVLYPLWFMEGMSEYTSGEIDEVQEEMVLRDAVTSGTYIPLTMLHGFNHVKPHQVTQAYKTGEAALDYIALEYGRDKVAALLRNIAEKFDMSSALQDVIGIGVPELDAKVREFLEEKYEEASAGMKEPEDYGTPLTRPDKIYPVFDSNPVFFPDGKRFAYISDQEGFPEIFIYDLALGRSLPLELQHRFPSQVEYIHQSGNGLSVSPDGRYLLFAGESQERDYLYLYDLARERLKRLTVPLEGVSSPQFSPDGKSIAFIGLRDGVSDVFLSKRNGKDLRQLTDTAADENYVRFFPDGKTLVFSREAKVAQPGRRDYERDLWTLSLETGKETRLTDLPGDEFEPAVSPAGDEILFVGDGTGVDNLYRMPAKGGAPERLTDVIGGNFYPAYSPDGKEILFVSHRKGEQHVYRGVNERFLSEPAAARRVPPAEAAASSDSIREVAPSTTAVALRGNGPYHLRASTDFFFPILFYSSTDGLFLSAYWQASEMLGNHQIQAAFTYASAFDFLNYQVFYSYLRFRPQIRVGFVGDTHDSTIVTTRDTRREDSQFVSVTYPFTRFDSLEARMTTLQRHEAFANDDLVALRMAGRENVASLAFTRDVSQGRYLETTSGYRVQAAYQDANAMLNSTLDYRNAFLTLHGFLPFDRESTFAMRLFGGASFGDNPQVFRTGGPDLIRGYGEFADDAVASRFVISNLEYRFPLFFDLNYHIWFFFPDFLFKNLYGAVFTDNGVLWNDAGELGRYRLGDVRNSFGTGLRMETFVLQTFPLVLQLDWARRTDNGEQTFYFTLGPVF